MEGETKYRERQMCQIILKTITGRTNQRVCCLDRLHSVDKSNQFFFFFKKKVRTKKRNENRY